jgi:hypothetical protein
VGIDGEMVDQDPGLPLAIEEFFRQAAERLHVPLAEAPARVSIKLFWIERGATSTQEARALLERRRSRIHGFTTTLKPGEEDIVRVDPSWFAAVVYGADPAAIRAQLRAAGVGGASAPAAAPSATPAVGSGVDEDAERVPPIGGGAGRLSGAVLVRARALLAEAGFAPGRIETLVQALDLLNPFMFRKYDIRGNARDVAVPDLTPEAAFWIGWSYASQLAPGTTFVLGRDMRPTGPALAEAMIEGAALAGVNVEYADVIGTGMMKWAYVHDQFVRQRPGGGHAVTISGSHSPLQVHGVKLGKAGRPFVDQQIQDLLKALQEARLVLVPSAQRGTRTERDITDEYRQAVGEEMRRLLGGRTLAGLRIIYAYTPGITTRPEIPMELLREFGAEVVPFEFQRQLVDPNEPHTAQELANEVHRVNELVEPGQPGWFGLFNDPDTDRAGMVNERGEVVSGDPPRCRGHGGRGHVEPGWVRGDHSAHGASAGHLGRRAYRTLHENVG